MAKPKRRKATTSKPFVESTVRVVDGVGRGAKPRPFDYQNAIRAFNSWMFAAAWLNAGAVANVPLRLYARVKSGDKLYATDKVSQKVKNALVGRCDPCIRPSQAVVRKAIAFGHDIEEVVEPHPILNVLQAMNPWENGYDYTILRMLDLQLTGNSYLHPVLDPILGIPFQAWRMPSQWVKVMPDKNLFIKGYLYGASTEVERKFKPDEVIHFKRPNPGDMWYGKGWYEAAWTAWALHMGKREQDTAFVDNLSRPDWLLSVKGANDKTLDRIESAVKEKLRGTDKTGNFMAVNAEVVATALNWETKEWGTPTRVIEELAAVSGVPVAMLLSNDPTKASSTTAQTAWYRNTIRPYCRGDEETLNAKWMPLFQGSEDYILAYDPVSFEDQEAVGKRLVGYVAGGILTPNEARAEEGYSPHEDGNELYPPAGTSGGAAALAGDMSPFQNGDRNNESPKPNAGKPHPAKDE